MVSLGIQSIHCYYFELPLVHPFYVRAQELRSKEGVVIHIISDDGIMGFGEVAPLPGISQETFKKALHQTEALIPAIKGLRAPLEPEALLQWFDDHFPDETVCPSVKFGFETAILSIVASIKGTTPAGFLATGEALPSPIRSAGLVQGTPADISRQARFLTLKGYSSFKLKVGGRNIPLDVQKVEALRHVIAPDAMIRLDANRSWRLDEALVFARNIGKDKIEFIEEPVADPTQLESFVKGSDMTVALDETLLDRSLEDVAGHPGISYAIIRPMVMGGVSGFMRFKRSADQLGIKTIVTSAFESGVGMTSLANCAALTSCVAHLGTANWFDEDLLLRPVVIDGGLIPEDRLSFCVKFLHQALARQLKAT